MKGTILAALVAFSQILFAQSIVVVNTKTNDDKSVDFTYEKNAPGNYTLIVTFKSLTNAFYTPTQYILSGPSGSLFTLKPSDKNTGISYSFSYRYLQGEHKPKGVDTSFVYLLPFQSDKSVQVFEHTNIGEVFLKQARPKGWKAYQFRGENLDSIFAVRKGIVVKVVDEYEYDTLSLYTSKTNNILVEHADGSIAVYKGFKKGFIAVKERHEVFPHSYLGLISNTPSNKKYLTIMMYYLSDTGFKEGSKAEHTFITPVFLTGAGAGVLENRQQYKVVVSTEVVTKEMNKRQKKEYGKTGIPGK